MFCDGCSIGAIKRRLLEELDLLLRSGYDALVTDAGKLLRRESSASSGTGGRRLKNSSETKTVADQLSEREMDYIRT